MALTYVPTKLDPRIVDKLESDVIKKKFNNRNEAINSILKAHYGIDGKKEKGRSANG